MKLVTGIDFNDMTDQHCIYEVVNKNSETHCLIRLIAYDPKHPNLKEKKITSGYQGYWDEVTIPFGCNSYKLQEVNEIPKNYIDIRRTM